MVLFKIILFTMATEKLDENFDLIGTPDPVYK